MQYDMVFEGGGAKGMVFVGALKELEARGITSARLLGTSAGSIMSTFLAAGYSADEMDAALREKVDGQPVFLGFLETPPQPSKEDIQNSVIREMLKQANMSFVPDGFEPKLDDAIATALATSRATSRIFSFIEDGGFFAANVFLDWLKTKLNSGIYNLDRGGHPQGSQRAFGEMTMAEFHKAVGTDLSLVAADTTDNMLLILNHRTAPDLPMIYGVRMSMSVPLLWHEVIWQEEWGTYRGKNITGNRVVDGGLLSNFPIELFLSNQPQVTDVMGEKTTDSSHVMGFLIDETMEVPGAPGKEEAPSGGFDFSKLRTVDRIKGLVNTMMQAHDKNVIETYSHLVIRLPAKSYGTIEFDMSDDRREALVNAGRSFTVAYFNQAVAAEFPEVLSAIGPADTPEMLEQADRIAESILFK